MNKFEEILKKQIKENYITSKDLKYKNESSLLLSPYEFGEYLNYKDELINKNEPLFVRLPLKSFNSKYIYYINCNELESYASDYYNELNEDLRENGSFLSFRMKNNIYTSRLYSEIEGSLNVENVSTTRKRLKDIIENGADLENRNDIIIKNMDLATKFILEKPDFNDENLFKLYNILSKDCLDEEDQLRKNEFYRYDDVEIDKYRGCPVDKIEPCMNTLFNFVNENLHSSNNVLLPHIAHYYILYVHPYFDYNGRTARMVSLWINILIEGNNILPPVISEAINQTKNNYYKAIEESRDSHNDLTYFLIYIYKTYVNYYLCYRNIESISDYAKNEGEVLTDTDFNYIKRILISNKGAFTYQDFLKMCNIEITKQGALKILNKYADLGILLVKETKSKNKLFEINNKIVKYRTNF